MLEKLLWADKTILKDNAKHQQPTPLCSTFARQKPRTSLAKELQNLRFCPAFCISIEQQCNPLNDRTNPNTYAHHHPHTIIKKISRF